jgi:putative transcriptional regulator
MLGQLAIDLEDASLVDRPVLQGGPVEPERGFVLHRAERSFEATLAVSGELRLTSSPDVLNALGRGTGPEPVLVALGYAGWGRGQLEAELSTNTWLTVPADPAIIFETPFEQRWTAALGLPGVDIRRITDYAGHA